MLADLGARGSGVSYYCQIGAIHDAQTRCELAMCFSIIYTEFDDYFRESGYYYRKCFQTDWEDDPNLAVCIQLQGEQDPSAMESHIDSFLETIHRQFSQMEEQYFNDKRNSLLALSAGMYADIVEEANYLWRHITKSTLDFNRRKWSRIYLLLAADSIFHKI